jgi:hypothetical protein
VPVTSERPTPLEQAPAIAEAIADSERPAAAAVQATRTQPRTQARTRAKPGSLLAARAATEYVYVGQDLRRILVVSAVLLGIMIAAWLAIAVLRIIPLDFY